MPSCCVIGCRSGYPKKESGITFHRFPTDVDRRKVWIEAVGRKDWVPTGNVRVCSLHFEKHMIDPKYANSRRMLLKDDAVPTIFDNTRQSYTRKKRKSTKVTTTSVDTVNLEKDAIQKDHLGAIPTIFDTWLSYSKSKKMRSEVTEIGNVEEATGPCSKVDSVSVELSDTETCSDFESLAKVNSLSKEPSYSSSNLRTMQLKRKIEYLEQQNELKSKEIKSLQRFKRHAVRKIRNLNEIIKFLKENRMMEEDSLKVLTFNRPMYPIGNIISTKLTQHQS